MEWEAASIWGNEKFTMSMNHMQESKRKET
jgi:hypothetical protein